MVKYSHRINAGNTGKEQHIVYETIQYEVRDRVATVTISRPKALNALSIQVLDELTAVFREIEQDETIRAVILTGEGRAFVAGADIAEMSAMDTLDGRAFGIKGHNLMNAIETLRIPVIAAINGFALGGGCELAMACDIRIASEKAKFGQPEVGLGLIPGFGGGLRLPRLVGDGMAKYLILSADTISAAEALRIGLVQKVVEPEQLMPEVEALAAKIAAKAPVAVTLAKHVLNNGANMSMLHASEFEINTFSSIFATQDLKEGTTAFLEKRPPEWKNH